MKGNVNYWMLYCGCALTTPSSITLMFALTPTIKCFTCVAPNANFITLVAQLSTSHSCVYEYTKSKECEYTCNFIHFRLLIE